MSRKAISSVLGLLVLVTLIWVASLDSDPAKPIRPVPGETPAVVLMPRSGVASQSANGVTLVVSVTCMIDEARVPVPHTDVYVIGGVTRDSGKDPLRVKGKADTQGKVRLELPAAGLWRVLAEHSGYFGSSQLCKFDQPGSEYTVPLEMIAFSVVTGRVIDWQGNVVPGAKVRAVVPPGTRYTMGHMHSDDRPTAREGTESDAEGRFRLEPIPPGVEISVEARREDVGRVKIALEPLGVGETRAVVLSFPKMTGVAGSVAGSPDKGRTTVECWHHNGTAYQLDAEVKGGIDENGRFIFRNVRPGTKTITTANQNGTDFTFGWITAEVKPGILNEVGVVPFGPNTVSFVALPEGAPKEPLTVRMIVRVVKPEPPYALYPLTIEVPAGTEVTLRGLPPGRFTAEVMVIEKEKRRQPGTPREYEVAQVAKMLSGLDRVDVVIPRFDPKALGDMTAELAPPPSVKPEEILAQVFHIRDGILEFASPIGSEGGGAFTIGRYQPGDYEFHAIANGYVANPVPCTIVGGASLKKRIATWSKGNSISGIALDADGRPLAGAKAILEQAITNEEGLRRFIYVMSRTVDEDGHFLIPSYPELRGLHLRVATRKGYSRPVNIDPRAGLQNAEIVARAR